MSNSYKFYSDTKDIMKKYVNATEGAIIYGISKSRIMVLASEAGAVYKVGNSALINTDIFEMYLEKFKEPTRPLPKHIWNEINAQFGFERAFGKTNDNADADTKITKFGISFNSDGTTTFFAQLEKSSASQKEYLEKLQEKKAAEKKEAKKKEQSKQTEVRKTTVQANSKEELLDKIKNIDWDSIKPEENKIGGRFDFSI